eukprot:4128483-Pleurochrysis_carterae.AAC.2
MAKAWRAKLKRRLYANEIDICYGYARLRGITTPGVSVMRLRYSESIEILLKYSRAPHARNSPSSTSGRA